MLPSQQELSHLLGSLYDAAGDPGLWTPFLQRLGHSTGARSVLLLMHSAGQDMYTISRSWEFDPDAIRAYHDYYHAFDLWAQRGLSKPAGTVCSSAELSSRKEIESTVLYPGLMVPCDIEYGMFGVIEGSATRWASVSLFRSNSDGEFEHDDLETLRFLTPHIRRAFKLHFQLSGAKARSDGFETALDTLPTGVIFLGTKGEIKYMNRAASKAVAERDGLLATRNGLRAEKQEESDLLAKMIRDAVSRSNGVELSGRGAVEISRRSRPPLRVVVSPIHDKAVDHRQGVAAVAFVHDPMQRTHAEEDVLRTRYQMTPAERRVAMLLAEGHSSRTIAQLQGVTFNTVRSQIKSVLHKAGVRRQGELIRLLVRDGVAS